VALGNPELKIQWQFGLYYYYNNAQINSITTISPLYFLKQQPNNYGSGLWPGMKKQTVVRLLNSCRPTPAEML